MNSASGLRVRFGQPSDISALFNYEKTNFPAVPGQRHDGYLFEDTHYAPMVLNEQIAAPNRFFTIVAEKAGSIVGFAVARPSSFPGTAGIDPTSMLLNYLAVDPAQRRNGIGSALISEIEKRSLTARQNVIIAHVPAGQAHFYRENGWDVYGDDRGYAWLPFNDHLRGDIGDPELGFPMMAAKVLRPKAVRIAFDFPVLSKLPVLDACTELMNLISAGRIQLEDLDPDTRKMVDAARLAPRLRKP